MSYLETKFIRKNLIYGLPLFIISIILILTSNFLLPTVNSIFQTRNDIEANNKKLTALTKKASDLSLLDPKELKTQFDTLSSAIPPEKDVPSLITGIERIAREASVSVTLLEVNAGSLATGSAALKNKNVSALNSLSANVTIKGSLTNIIDFIAKASRGRRLLKIQGINLGSLDVQKARDSISMTLIVSVYYQALPSSLGEISTPIAQISEEEQGYYNKIKNYPLYTTLQNNAPEVAISEVTSSNLVPVGKTDLFNR